MSIACQRTRRRQQSNAAPNLRGTLCLPNFGRAMRRRLTTTNPRIAFGDRMNPTEVTAAKFRALQAMAKDKSLTSAEVRLGIVLLGYFNAERGYAWPSNETLAQELGIHRTTVTSAWQGLRAKGYFIVQENKGRGTTNRYYPVFVSPPEPVLTDTGDVTVTSPDDDGSLHTIDGSLHNNRRLLAQEGTAPRGNIPSKKPSKNPISKPLRDNNGKFSSLSQDTPPDGGPPSDPSEHSLAEPLEPTEATASVTQAPNCLQGDREVSEAERREVTAALLSKTVKGFRGPMKPPEYWAARKDSEFAAGLTSIDQEDYWRKRIAEEPRSFN